MLCDVEEMRKEKEREHEEMKRHYNTEINRYEVLTLDYSVAINERQGLLAERAQLLQSLD